MTSIELKKLLLGTTLIAGFTALASAPTFAQDNTDDPVVEIVEDDEDEADDEDNEVIVTGSRLKKNTFNSIKPLQVIDFEETREIGLVDTIEILQTNEAAAGTQIDSSFGGFVNDNGPGSETIDLRGLGANRTLVLVNGRRLAPLGVEGAPSQASINAIPSILIENVDLLLEGSSTVYGSDALAGVVNATIARDFEGFEVSGSTELAEQGGEDYTIAARYGKNWDRAFFSIAGEYDRRDSVRLSDREFFNDCTTNVEITESGEIRRNNVESEVLEELYGLSANPFDVNNPCTGGGGTSRFVELSGPIPFGGIFPNVAGANENFIGIPGFTDPFVFLPVDADGDRVADISLREFYSRNGVDNTQHIITPQERFNVFSYGEFTIDGAANVTPFYEVLYSQTEIFQDLGGFTIDPFVGATNEFNPCGTNGVNCGIAGRFNQDFSFNPEGIFNNPTYRGDFNTHFRDRDPNRDGDFRDARICATFGLPQLPDGSPDFSGGPGPFDNAFCNPDAFGLGFQLGPEQVFTINSIEGDRTEVDIKLNQTRLVGGFKGDLPGFNYDPDGFLNFSDWSFEVAATHSISNGSASRPGIREDRLNLALGNLVNPIRDAEGNVIVDRGTPIDSATPCVQNEFEPINLTSDVTNGCVPVNLFAPAALEVRGQLTRAERDYLFDLRDFDTSYYQTVFGGFIAGEFADLPAGKAQASIGFEWRRDEIDSRPDDIARDGLFYGFFSDQGAVGSRNITELFGEVSLPIVADKPFFEQLTVDAGVRWLDDEYFGQEAVYSVAGGWRPFDSLLLRASYGTSFRAPNLRELFLKPQTGFIGVFDPCVAPGNAFRTDLNDPTAPPVYDGTLDSRDPNVIARCVAEGLPVDLGNGTTNANTGVEVFNEGNLNLDPETSTSLTVGMSFEQPFTDKVDFNFGVNYYDIDVANTVISPGGQFIVNDCFVFENESRSVFCDRIGRDGDGFLDTLGLGFINLNEEEVRGLDFNSSLLYEFDAFDNPLTFRLTGRANHLIERRTLFIGDDGNPFADTGDGEFGLNKWTGSLVATLGFKDFRANWFTRYVGDAEQDPDGVDTFANAFGIDTDDNGTGETVSQTCLGPAFGDENCRDVGFADDYFVHNASISYFNEDKNLRLSFGVNNVFDEDPPIVDGSEVLSISNVPIGAGYSVNGRTFVIQARKGF